MGLKLRYNLFYSNVERVYESFASFYPRARSKVSSYCG